MLDLVKILKDCPKGIELYSVLHGEVTFDHVNNIDGYYPIVVKYNDGQIGFTRDGKYYIEYDGECVLFPSKDQRDWSKFKVPVKKFDYSTLKPFDRVLIRDYDNQMWKCDLFTCMVNREMICKSAWSQGIPYNDDTMHLAGTTDKPNEKYIWWE